VHDTGAVGIAQDMLRRHGLRAQAVAMERMTEMRRLGDPVGMHRWEQAYAAICELRRSAAARKPPEE
jgi:hypothetical protein